MATRLKSRSGQFIPLTAMIMFTAVLLMVAGMNIYRIAKAKLQVQNMADAAALSLASMEAKAINTVVDRNEWMNHMYGDGYKNKPGTSLPNISDAEDPKAGSINDKSAQAYANLVATVNKAQNMFIQAYDNFLGAKDETQSSNTGAVVLADILGEIDGLRDPLVRRIWVFNSGNGPSSQDLTNAPPPSANNFDIGPKLGISDMHKLKFETEDVHLGGSNKPTLATLAGTPSGQKVGWMYPVWKNSDNNVQVAVTKNAGTEPHWGVGVTIIKDVPLLFFPIASSVQSTSIAYVVENSGAVGKGFNGSKPEFRPTFYAKLAYHP